MSGPISVTMKVTSSTPHENGAKPGNGPREGGGDADHHPHRGQRRQGGTDRGPERRGRRGDRRADQADHDAEQRHQRGGEQHRQGDVGAEPAGAAGRGGEHDLAAGPTARSRRGAAPGRCPRPRPRPRRSGSRWRRRRSRPCRPVPPSFSSRSWMAGVGDHVGDRPEQRPDDHPAEHHADGPADDRAAGQPGDQCQRPRQQAPGAQRATASRDDAGPEVAAVEHRDGDGHTGRRG